ncbi:zinc finger protein 90 homolog isoform X1 [Pleurodeles waltl]
MEVTAGAPRQLPRKERVSFQDVAAHFSKEDWKLLHQWQTELYETVIKEIHHTLMSLGPLIADAVFSLKPKEREEVLILDQEDSKMRDGSQCPSSDMITSSDVSFRSQQSTKLEIKGTEDPNQWGNQYHPSAEFPFPNSDTALREENAFESSSKDHRATDLRERSIGSSAGDIQVIIKEEETNSRDLRESEQREDIYMNTEHEAITQLVPCIIKEDGTAHSMEHEDSSTRGSSYVPTDDRVFKRKMSYKESDRCTKKALLMGKVKTKGFLQKETGMLAKMFPGSNQELADERSAPCGGAYMKDTYTHLYPGLGTGVALERHNECESEAQSTALAVYPQDGRKIPSSNCVQTRSPLEDLGKVSLGSGLGDVSSLSDQCAAYSKTFHRLGSEIALERTLSADRPYVCVKCYKRFRNMWKLTRHQATHSKERPYICAECGKNYNRSDSLLRHQKSHTERLVRPCAVWTTPVYEHQKGAALGHSPKASVQSSL